MKPKILLLTPYKHLPEFNKILKNNFIVIDGTDTNNIDDVVDICNKKSPSIVFYAPNYKGIFLDDTLLPECVQIIATPSTGLNHINSTKTKVFSVKNDDVLKKIYSTAEHNLFLILSLAKSIANPPIEISNKSIGILGHGRLGKMLYNYLKPLFKEVYISDLYYGSSNFYNSDFLTINVDLNPSSTEMINEEYISKFKKNIYIVNTARGEVVNENDLLKLIKTKKVLGYATDVIQNEYSDKQSVILNSNLNNVLITPHIGGTSIYAQELAYQKTINKVINDRL